MNRLSNAARTFTLESGWGYWDVTHYPRGGCFRRLTADIAIVIDDERNGEIWGKLPDGRRICITRRALKS